jgi:hypothetical protein
MTGEAHLDASSGSAHAYMSDADMAHEESGGAGGIFMTPPPQPTQQTQPEDEIPDESGYLGDLFLTPRGRQVPPRYRKPRPGV